MAFRMDTYPGMEHGFTLRPKMMGEKLHDEVRRRKSSVHLDTISPLVIVQARIDVCPGGHQLGVLVRDAARDTHFLGGVPVLQIERAKEFVTAEVLLT